MPDATITKGEIERLASLCEKVTRGAQRVIDGYVRGEAKQDEQQSLNVLRKGLDDALVALIDRAEKVSKPVDTLTPALYARHRGVFCPVCLHSDLEYGDLEIDDPNYQEVNCAECGASWKDIYPLTGYDDLKRLPGVVCRGGVIWPVRATVRVSVGGSEETTTYDTNILVKSQYGEFSVEDVLRYVRHVHRFVELVHYQITGPSLTEYTP